MPIVELSLRFSGMSNIAQGQAPNSERSENFGILLGSGRAAFPPNRAVRYGLVQFLSGGGFADLLQGRHQFIHSTNLDGGLGWGAKHPPIAVSDIEHHRPIIIPPPPAPHLDRYFAANPLASLGILYPAHGSQDIRFGRDLRLGGFNLMINRVYQLLSGP